MKDLKHYLALLAILSVGLALFWLFDYNRQVQAGITLVMAAAYVFWGVVHHLVKKDLRWQVILEYVVVAVVASVVLIFLLMRT